MSPAPQQSPTQQTELPPALTEALAAHFGFEVREFWPLGGELDTNLRVVTAEGASYLVKVTPPGIPDDVLAWQEGLLAHLAGRDLSVRVPAPVLLPDGRPHFELELAGELHRVRVLEWIDGEILATQRWVGPELLRRWGRVAAEMTLALDGLAAPAPGSGHHWLVTESEDSIVETQGVLQDSARQRQVDTIMGWFRACRPLFDRLPRATVHQDLNDYNVLVERRDGVADIVGVLDFNDARPTIRVSELAVAVAYSMLRTEDPIAAAEEVVAGYNELLPLSEDELAVLFPLAAARLCVNAVTWLYRSNGPNPDYGAARAADTWPAIARVVRYHPLAVEDRLRRRCGHAVPDVLSGLGDATSPLPDGAAAEQLDLSPASELFDEAGVGLPAVRRAIADRLHATDAPEVLLSPAFTPVLPLAARRDVGAAEPETVQLGLGIVAGARIELRAPFDGIVVEQGTPDQPLVIVHNIRELRIHTLWWGLDGTAPIGTPVRAGDVVGIARAFDETGESELLSATVQLATDPRLAVWLPPQTVRPSEFASWARLSPDPAMLLGTPPALATRADDGWTVDRVLEVRRERLAPSQKSYFDRPMNLVRGSGAWLYDENAFAYLDPINNVTHVGHANPEVAAAAVAQLRRLNTNSRLVYPQIAQYAERLASTFPAGLDVVFFVCTGSEANDLALRIARQVTGREHVVVIDSAYHGNTTAVTAVSPDRYNSPGGAGRPATTREVPTPDRYHGPYGYDDPDAGVKYAGQVAQVVDRMVAEGTPPAAFIAESLIGTGGNHVLPPGYLEASYASVRSAGGLCIADEVQIGFGRSGAAFWAFETQGVVPDIVTMGKPMGNGQPLAAVVTTREIAEEFDNGVRYFNTFGGNPVSCAIGMTVLDIIERDGLQQRAAELGEYFIARLREVAAQHPLIGDVRGMGLYIGVEIVSDPETKEPDRRGALLISEMLKDRGVVMYPNGRFGNVLKIKPPMVFTPDDAELFAAQLGRVLTQLEAQRAAGAPE